MRLPERIDTLGAEARGQLRHALEAGNEKLMELDQALARLAKDDWSVPGFRRHLGELRARAEDLRAAALKRASELPARAVTGLATRTRGPVRGLAKELAEIAKRVAPPARPTVVKAAPAEPEPADASKAKAS
jgi:hypothetical protein